MSWAVQAAKATAGAAEAIDDNPPERRAAFGYDSYLGMAQLDAHIPYQGCQRQPGRRNRTGFECLQSSHRKTSDFSGKSFQFPLKLAWRVFRGSYEFDAASFNAPMAQQLLDKMNAFLTPGRIALQPARRLIQNHDQSLGPSVDRAQKHPGRDQGQTRHAQGEDIRRVVKGFIFSFLAGKCDDPGLKAGFSIEAATGSRTGNPFEIRLTTRGSELRAVLINRSSSEQKLLHSAHLQAATLELISPTGSRHAPYDSRRIMKYDTTPYCHLFQTLAPGKKLELGSVPFRQARDGFAGQWGPFNFEELPAGDYQARVTWLSERAQCVDESPRQTRKLPSVWRGIVHSNPVTLHLQ